MFDKPKPRQKTVRLEKSQPNVALKGTCSRPVEMGKSHSTPVISSWYG